VRPAAAASLAEVFGLEPVEAADLPQLTVR